MQPQTQPQVQPQTQKTTIFAQKTLIPATHIPERVFKTVQNSFKCGLISVLALLLCAYKARLFDKGTFRQMAATIAHTSV